MSTDLESVSLSTTVNSPAGSGGRALSANVRRLHIALNLLLSDFERGQFIHCLNVYHAKRNVYDLVQTLKVILDTPNKRQLMPMLRLVIPRSDQLLFDQYTSEGLYLQTDLLPHANDFIVDGECANRGTVFAADSHFAGADGSTTTIAVAPQQGGALFAEPFGDFRQVTLKRSRSHEGLGFSIRGGSEHGVGIYVSLVEPGSSAEREGLRVGDQIVSVNDAVFDRVTHIEAVKVLKGSKMLVMSVCLAATAGGTGGCLAPGGCPTNHMYSWVDPEGRAVSPPPASPDTQEPDGAGGGRPPEERTVNLNMDDGRSLGLMIRGGAEYGLGIFITGVDPGSAADVGALKVGDQILEVNGRSFVSVSHDEAVHTLKTGRHLLVRVRDVGRLPHARAVTAVDGSGWMHGPTGAAGGTAAMTTASGVASACNARPSSARSTPALGKPVACRGVGPPGTQVTLEEQAYLLLTEQERQTMGYYLQEYCEGHIGVEPLAMALFELFNTHAKLSLLSEVRDLVAPQDLELYDGMVLHRERETHQAWQQGGVTGVSHPQAPCINATTKGNAEPLRESPPAQSQSGAPSRERGPSRRGSARLASSSSSNSSSFRDPTRHLQGCLHRSFRSIPGSQQTPTAPHCPHYTSPGSQQTPASSHCPHYTSPGSQQTPTAPHCPHYPSPSSQQTPTTPHCPHYPSPGSQQTPTAPHATHYPSPGLSHSPEHPPHPYNTCLGFPPHRRGSNPPESTAHHPFPRDKPSVLIRSASSSRTASPVLSPRPSPCPSPCPSLVTPGPPPGTPERRFCSPTPDLDLSRLTAGCIRPQQRGATLSQLSDSGQTLSEDSGVDIAEAGGAPCRDGSLRPCRGQEPSLLVEPPPGSRPPALPLSRQTGSPVPVVAATMVRVPKNAPTLGIAIEGGANTRQPLPRIVNIQKGGSAHSSGQLKVGHLILEVNGVSLNGQEHKDAARIIAEAFKTKEKDHIDFLVAEL